MLYHEGCKITIGGSWQQDDVTPNDPVEDRRTIAEAAKLAARADVVVLCIGGNEQTSREAWMGNHLGDRTSLDMVGLQDELVDAIAATGKPIVAVLFNGRPLSIRNVAEKAAAILECWYLGQETGTAVAEALFGDVNPGGKLPITIPRSVGHLPAYYNYRPSARRGYLFDDVSPLFPFGFGLSYTTFEFGPPRLEKATIGRDEIDAGAGGRDEHRRAGGRRSGAAVHPRPGEQRHAAGEGAQGLRADHARSRAKRGPWRSKSRRIGWRSGISTSSGLSSRANLRSWWGRIRSTSKPSR